MYDSSETVLKKQLCYGPTFLKSLTGRIFGPILHSVANNTLKLAFLYAKFSNSQSLD